MDESHPNVLAEQLKVLEELRVGGIFTEDEFESIKKKLLAKQLKASLDARPEQATEPTPPNNQEQPPSDATPIDDPYRSLKAFALNVLTIFGFGFANAARTEQATELTQLEKQEQPPSDATPGDDPYRSLKSLALDGLIVFGFGFAGATLVALAFHFGLRPTAAMAPLALADVLSYTLGFSVVGTRASDEQYWRRQLYVAIIAWPIGIVEVPFWGLSITGWAFSGIWIALAVALGGVIALHLRRLSKSLALVEVKVGPWKWGKIQLRTMLPAAASAAAIVILGTSYIAYDNETKPETVYSNLKLGMTMRQVKHAKGDSPSQVGVFQDAKGQDLAQGGAPIHDILSQRTLLLLDATKLPIGKKVDDYPVWAYSSTDQHTVLRVDFDPHAKTLTGVACIATAYDGQSPFGMMDCQDLLGIQDRWSEDALVEKLGKPNEEKTDGDVKIFRYTDLGVQYFLMQGGVFMLSLFSTQ